MGWLAGPRLLFVLQYLARDSIYTYTIVSCPPGPSSSENQSSSMCESARDNAVTITTPLDAGDGDTAVLTPSLSQKYPLPTRFNLVEVSFDTMLLPVEVLAVDMLSMSFNKLALVDSSPRAASRGSRWSRNA